jgi:hypothetical protein
MGQIDENLYPFEDNVVGFIAFDICNETDTTGIVFIAGIVQALGGREKVARRGFSHCYYPGSFSNIAIGAVLGNKKISDRQHQLCLW